jgi:hypothetical protein
MSPQLPAASPQLVGLRSEKVLACHRDRLAIVYVRQSTAQQVLNHQESTRLQYGLVDRAQALGWPADRVLVIDEDLGRSGTRADDRAGFQRLVLEVSLDHVGLILGVEMSRLARVGRQAGWPGAAPEATGSVRTTMRAAPGWPLLVSGRRGVDLHA